jgi:phenylpropionate dioxygenase-like ring-hydroxylating dioxygenase large terminal subunit
MSTKAVLADDVEIARRLLAHIDAGTTDVGEPWREPVANYVDEQRFADELQLLRGLPKAYVPSAAIPNPGDHVERISLGVPLFAVRDHDGRARVFRNACRHRGMAVVEGPGCAHALVCRYHGWTYRLDGSLSHVPHADGFPDLDPPSRGLVEVASHEVDGLIVIGDDPGTLTDGTPWRDKLLPAAHLVHVNSVMRAMNWKVLVEQFLEGYHIRTTHRETFYPLQYDNLNIVETFGPHSRITFPYRNIERLRDRHESTWVVNHRVTFVYHLFPNVIIATFPDLVIMLTIDPVDVGHTAVTTYFMSRKPLKSKGSGGENAGVNLITQGALEDNEMSEGVQHGLHAGANTFVEFGRHESAIGHFHARLREGLTPR